MCVLILLHHVLHKSRCYFCVCGGKYHTSEVWVRIVCYWKLRFLYNHKYSTRTNVIEFNRVLDLNGVMVTAPHIHCCVLKVFYCKL